MRFGIGIDIGGTKIRAARVSEAGETQLLMVQPTASQAGDVVGQIDALIAALESADAIGIGIPGRVDVAAGTIFSGGFVDLSGAPLAGRLRSAGTSPIFIDNDANMALAAEARIGAAAGLDHVVMLTIGTGIGGAIMGEGRLVHGRATAGQLGHITIDLDGLPCLCGRKGCLETMSSGTALGRLIAGAGLAATTTAHELLNRTDEAAHAIIAAWALPLRAGIDSLAAILDPQRVILGGGLGRDACTALERFPATAPWYQCDIAPAQLGDNAGVIGAALSALERAL